MTKVLVATEKPFAKVAVDGIREIVEKAGFELVLLENYTDKSELLKAVADVDAIICRSDKITKEVVDAAQKLRIVVRAGAGFDNLDLDALKAKGVVAMNTPGQNSNAVVELVVGLMIMMARGKYTGKAGRELRGKRMGIHGYGHIGKILAQVAQGLGMEVYCFSIPLEDKAELAKAGVTLLDSVEELFDTCEYISTHVPANPHTIGCMNYDLVRRMPKGATLINTARKEIVNEDDLLKLLAERDDFRYVADVRPDKADEFEKFGDRVLFTPKKMGAQTAEANINAGLAAANQIVGYIQRGDTTFQLNK